MKLITVFLLLVLYHVSMRLLGKLVTRKTRLQDFQKLLFLTPFSIAITYLFIHITDLSFEKAGLTFGDPEKGFLIVFILGLPIAVISAISIFFIPESEIRKLRYGRSQTMVSQLLYVWIFVGIVEELLYRGFLQGNLQKVISGEFLTVGYATIVSSIIFVAVHLGNIFLGGETLRQFVAMLPGRLIVALVLGYTFQISGSLLYPIIIHNLIDGLNMSLLIYRKKKIFDKNLPSNNLNH